MKILVVSSDIHVIQLKTRNALIDLLITEKEK